MTEDLQQPLLAGARIEKEVPLYVLVFPNVFAQKKEDTETMPVKQANDYFDMLLEPTRQQDIVYHVRCT